MECRARARAQDLGVLTQTASTSRAAAPLSRRGCRRHVVFVGVFGLSLFCRLVVKS